MKTTAKTGARLTTQQQQEALFYWHLFDANASKVARQIGTTPKTVLALAERENFNGKRALVQHRISEVIAQTDDPALQRLVETDIRMLQIAEMMLNDVHKAIKKKHIKVRNMGEAVTILKYIGELRSKILGPLNGDDGERKPSPINIEKLQILNMNELAPGEKRQVLKILAERAQA